MPVLDRPIHLLARALILLDGHVLVVRCKGAPNTFLPGGHVAFGEPALDALTREIDEELGLPSRVGGYLGAVEHEWSEGEHRQHEINHVFAVSLPTIDRPRAMPSRETHLEFFWVPLDGLPHHDLRPPPIVELVRRHALGAREPFWGSTLRPRGPRCSKAGGIVT